VPIIAPHPHRSGTRKPSQLPKINPVKAPKPPRELSWAQRDRYRVRTMSERVNARLKDEFGANHLRVRGADKVMAHSGCGSACRLRNFNYSVKHQKTVAAKGSLQMGVSRSRSEAPVPATPASHLNENLRQ